MEGDGVLTRYGSMVLSGRSNGGLASICPLEGNDAKVGWRLGGRIVEFWSQRVDSGLANEWWRCGVGGG